MSQHDYNIANGGGAAVRADLNNALQAILSQNAGATAPTTTKPFMFWYDTTTGVLKMRNAADTAWVDAITGVSGGNGLGMVNRIINGDMRIDQRNAGAAVTINSGAQQYAVDRFVAQGQTTDGVFTVQQSSVAPTGFSNSLLATVTTADASIGAAQFYWLTHRIEGYNVSDFGFGAAGASSVTLSFWVRSSLTGTFGASLTNDAADRSYPFSYTINAANTWEQKTVTIAGDTTGTWLKTNGIGCRIYWNIGAGSNYTAAAGAWVAQTATSASGSVNLIGTSGATFYVTGVDLRKGTFTSAPAWDYRPYGTELALCQRYYATGGIYGWPRSNDNVSLAYASYKVTMRAVPTTTLADGAVQSGTPDSRTVESFGAYKTGTSASTAWATTWTASAEL